MLKMSRFDSSRWGGGSDGHLYDVFDVVMALLVVLVLVLVMVMVDVNNVQV